MSGAGSRRRRTPPTTSEKELQAIGAITFKASHIDYFKKLFNPPVIKLESHIGAR